MSTYLVDIVTTETKRNVLQISMRKRGEKRHVCNFALSFLLYAGPPQIQFAGRLATFVVGL